MADGIEGATAAFAEDLGAGGQTRNRVPVREDGARETDTGNVERILNPSQEREVEPGGGDADFEEQDEAGDVEGDERDRDPATGRFKPRKPETRREAAPERKPSGTTDINDLLENDPLDEEEGEAEDTGGGNAENDRRAVKFDPADMDVEVEVTVDGTKSKVPLREALDGYIRQETFHRRLTELDKGKTAIRAERQQIDEGRDFYIQRLQSLQQQLDSMTPAEPDWEKRFQEDPVRAGQEMQQWNKYKASREAMEAERRAELQKSTEARNRAFQEFVVDERGKFAAAHPEYSNPTDGAKRWERDRNDMRDTAKNHGFTDEEINNIVDSRYMDVLLKASKYDRLLKRAKNLKPTPSTARNAGGASRTPAKPNGARRRLSNTGSISDAASVFAAELAREG